jgi:site-specific DNA-methyltransferase (adenine-specific)
MIDLRQGDCLEAMREMKDNQFDLAIVDPPYGIGADKEKYTPKNHTWNGKKKVGYTSKNWDKEIPNEDYFNELFRVSKNQIVWGGNYFGLSGGYIFWDKQETMPTFTKGELAWCSFMNKIDKFEWLWSGYKKKENETRIHPTQKPVALYKWLLDKYAKQGDKILDTHLGSGSIAIACHNLGFDLTGFELDNEYYEAAVKRLKTHQSQKTIFEHIQEQEKGEQKQLF